MGSPIGWMSLTRPVARSESEDLCMKIEATYSIVTPMFCSAGADAQPEVRPPSFKGVLRFWWRAIAWSQLAADSPARALERLQHEENYIFGSSEKGQSGVLLSIDEPAAGAVLKKGSHLAVRTKGDAAGIAYLGYGVLKLKRGQAELGRAALKAGGRFRVVLRCPDLDVGGPRARWLLDALRAIGTVGGLGARARRGFGSIALERLVVDSREAAGGATSMEELIEEVARLIGSVSGAGDGWPPITAFSKKTRIVIAETGSGNSLEALESIGREFLAYRSWGAGGRGPVVAERNFKQDHDLMLAAAPGNPPARHPARVAFGLPHNYYFRSQDKPVSVSPGADLDRRASPLFFHIHPVGRDYAAVVSFLPAVFLPASKRKVTIKPRGSKPLSVPLDDEETLYKPIEAFLDRLLDADKRKEKFVRVEEVARV